MALTSIRSGLLAATTGIVGVLIGMSSATLSRTAAASGTGHDHVVFSGSLPNVPGKVLTAVEVDYAPGGASPPHRHAGSVFAYVVSGEIRSENSVTGPVRVYHAGEGFFEPPASVHLVSANASASAPATLLAVFVADEGATLTLPAK